MRPTFIIAANLFPIKNNQVLLGKRANTGYQDGYYGCIGGHLEVGETLRQGVVREAQEEVGITIEVDDLKPAVFMHNQSTDGRLQCFFVVEKWQGEPSIREPEKCNDLQWFPIDALPENTAPYVREALKAYLENRIYCEFGW